MGAFTVEIEVGDLEGQQSESLEALVDTGSSYPVVQRRVLARLVVNGHRAPPVHAGG